jgi:hypothetical protein
MMSLKANGREGILRPIVPRGPLRFDSAHLDVTTLGFSILGFSMPPVSQVLKGKRRFAGRCFSPRSARIRNSPGRTNSAGYN